MKKNKNHNTLDELILSDDELKLISTLRHKHMSTNELREYIKGLKHPKKSQIKLYNLQEGKKFIFGVIGDTHFGNKSTMKQELQAYYNLAYTEGVRTVFHAGDLVDGLHVHRGQEYELYALGLNDQCNDVIQDYPHKRGLKTYYILGNHDNWYKSNSGSSIEHKISKERKDMICLGELEADILIGNKSKIRLMHPGGGSSYALSYKPQKIIESISGGNKPNLLFIGHYHKMLQMFYRNVHAFLVGTFEAQTPYMRSKNLSAHIGGWIIEGISGKQGGIKQLKSKFIPFYERGK